MVIHIVAKRLIVVLSLLPIWLVAMASVSAWAETATDCETDCVPIGEWSFRVGLGVGLRANPLYDGDDTPLVVLPELSYYGKRFFLKNFEMGYTFLESDRHQLNALITPGYDQMLFNRWDPLNFTDHGGFSGVSTFSPPGPASSPNTYQVNISYTDELAVSSGVTGVPDGENRNPGSIISDPLPLVPSEVAPDIAVGGVSRIYVNGKEIDIAPGQQQTITGIDANVIGINYTEDGMIAVSGLTESDVVRLQGDGLNIDDPAVRSSPDEAATSLGNDIIVGLDGGEAVIEQVPAAPGDTSDIKAKQVSADQVRKRKVAGLAGLEYSYRSDSFSIHLQALQDFTNVHQGAEVRAAFTVPWQYKSHQFALTTGVNWQSRKVIDYYYGVTFADVGDDALLYEPLKAAFTPLFRLDWQKNISEHWSLRGFVQYMPLSREVKASPLVDSSNISAVFVGGVYHF